MYRHTRHGTRPRLGLGLGLGLELGLEFAHGRACASLLTFLYTSALLDTVKAPRLIAKCFMLSRFIDSGKSWKSNVKLNISRSRKS